MRLFEPSTGVNVISTPPKMSEKFQFGNFTVTSSASFPSRTPDAAHDTSVAKSCAVVVVLVTTCASIAGANVLKAVAVRRDIVVVDTEMNAKKVVTLHDVPE